MGFVVVKCLSGMKRRLVIEHVADPTVGQNKAKEMDLIDPRAPRVSRTHMCAVKTRALDNATAPVAMARVPGTLAWST